MRGSKSEMAKAAPGPPPSPLSQPHSPFSPVGHQAPLTYLEKGRGHGVWSCAAAAAGQRACEMLLIFFSIWTSNLFNQSRWG